MGPRPKNREPCASMFSFRLHFSTNPPCLAGAVHQRGGRCLVLQKSFGNKFDPTFSNLILAKGVENEPARRNGILKSQTHLTSTSLAGSIAQENSSP